MFKYLELKKPGSRLQKAACVNVWRIDDIFGNQDVAILLFCHIFIHSGIFVDIYFKTFKKNVQYYLKLGKKHTKNSLPI